MSQWVPVYRDKDKTDERWACTGCGAHDDHNHHHGPGNGVCSCDMRITMVPSEAYRQNYERIFGHG